MTRPILLDLYCGAGGATRGYQLAGFDVMGVDIKPQPEYCGFDFVQADALEFLKLAIRLPGAFAAVHASPPCQRYTTLAKGNNANEADYPDLIGPTRELLQQTGLPYVIENVPSAPLLNPVTLCGEMFGLGVIRHRKFESNLLLIVQGGKLMDTVDNLRPLDHITDEALLFHRDWQMGSVVQEVHTGDCCEDEEFCNFYPQLWEMAFMCGWTRSGSYYYNPDDDSPRLPVRVLWNPAWEAS